MQACPHLTVLKQILKISKISYYMPFRGKIRGGHLVAYAQMHPCEGWVNKVRSKKSMTDAYDHLYKLILIGDSAVGKSNILSRFTSNKFNASSAATIGVEFTTKTLTVEVQGKMISTRLQCWDTAGQERYRSITSSYYRGAHGCLLVFDVTKRTSFEHCTEWLTELRNASAGPAACKVILVGNKVDLRHLREVTTEEATAFAQQHNLAYIETSASSGHGIDDAFKRLVAELAAAELANTAMSGAQRQLPAGVAPIPQVSLNNAARTKQKKRC